MRIRRRCEEEENVIRKWNKEENKMIKNIREIKRKKKMYEGGNKILFYVRGGKENTRF